MQDFQEKVKNFSQENMLQNPIEHRVLDLVSELGEVAKEILKMSNYGRQPIQVNSEINSELGDAFYSLITVANYFEVNLDEALDMVLEKYRQRLKKVSAGSEDD